MCDSIPLDKCIDRRIYKLSSRNLSVGVFREETRGFIGIREKFGSRYLFEEYHYDTGAPYGTAVPYQDTGIDLPGHIELDEHLPGTYGSNTGKAMHFQVHDGDYKGAWYYHFDDSEVDEDDWACCKDNRVLFNYLLAFEIGLEP